MKRQLLTIFILFISCYAFGGEIIVNKGESLHHALRQAREWRRTNDARCQGGITITLQEGRYYMQEPLFLRPEDSGTKESPLVIRGKRQSVICGDARQQHTQVWPKDGMMRMIDFNTTDKTITIPTPPEDVLSLLTQHPTPNTHHLTPTTLSPTAGSPRTARFWLVASTRHLGGTAKPSMLRWRRPSQP